MVNCLLGVGKPREAHWRQALAVYAARLRRFGGCALEFVRPEAEASGRPAEDIIAREGTRLHKHLRAGDMVWVLAVEGQSLSSPQLARQLAAARGFGRLVLVAGGQLGLSREVKAQAGLLLSLGAITLPHELAAVVALEQLYRAHTILAGLPYHRS
jgi:23S rRNA (pseudouridine1915-N3)-methyltransferase